MLRECLLPVEFPPFLIALVAFLALVSISGFAAGSGVPLGPGGASFGWVADVPGASGPCTVLNGSSVFGFVNSTYSPTPGENLSKMPSANWVSTRTMQVWWRVCAEPLFVSTYDAHFTRMNNFSLGSVMDWGHGFVVMTFTLWWYYSTNGTSNHVGWAGNLSTLQSAYLGQSTYSQGIWGGPGPNGTTPPTSSRSPSSWLGLSQLEALALVGTVGAVGAAVAAKVVLGGKERSAADDQEREAPSEDDPGESPIPAATPSEDDPLRDAF